MSGTKLSSAEVPTKFAEWLLNIGCPPDKVPSVEKVTEMCRGQYYMVWRSLMEHVEPKAKIREKRLQVFCDDVKRWKNSNAFNKLGSNAVVPEEIALWLQQNDVKSKVVSAESRIDQAQKSLNQLMDKISTKLSHSKLSRQKLKDVQRRAWFLQQIAEELKAKKDNLEETRNIAKSLCLVDEEVDVQSKLEQYLKPSCRTTQKPTSNSLLASNPVACSTVDSAYGETNDAAEDQLSWVAKCEAAPLWTAVSRRRSQLVGALSEAAATKPDVNLGVSPQAVLSYTASTHCSLALEAMKCKVHLKETRKKFAAAITELNNYLPGEACELLVLRCERARSAGRVVAMRNVLQDLISRGGHFHCGNDTPTDNTATLRQINAVDRAIEAKKDELKRLISSLAITERKLQNVRECVLSIFNGFQKDLPVQRLREHSQEPISALRHFYEERREIRRNKMQLSMDFDSSDNCSYSDGTDKNLKYADELKVYLRKFRLEKNSKLVFESGQKIWCFETVDSSINRLFSSWKDAEVSCFLLCPANGLATNLLALITNVQRKSDLEMAVKAIDDSVPKVNLNIDVPLKAKEESIADKIKKTLNDNIQSLQKTNKTLDIGQKNLAFWSDNEMKKYISHNRRVDGKTYQECEMIYKESLSLR